MSQQWQYHMSEIVMQLLGTSVTERIRDELDKRGAQGWELTAVEHVSMNASTRLYFKKSV